HRRRDGSLIDVEISSHVVECFGRRAEVVLAHDVTARLSAERALKRLNRLYAMLSQTNQLLVRATDRQALFSGICQIAVHHGGFRFAVMELFDTAQAPHIAASAGEASGMETLARSLYAAEGLGAFRAWEPRPFARTVVNDLFTEPTAEAWRDTAVRVGVRTMARFPVRAGGRIIGALALFGAEAGFFGDDELRTLDEVIADLSFGLDVLERNRLLQVATQVVDASPVVLFRWRPEPGWPVEFVSANVARWGYTPESFTSGDRPFSSIVHPDERARVGEEANRFAREGRGEFVQTYRILTSTGDVRWIEDSTAVERDRDGRIVRLQGTVTDVTERRVAELALATTDRRFRATIEQAAVGIAHVSMDGQLLDVNRRFCEIVGCSREEWLGDDVRALLSDGGVEFDLDEARSALDGRVASHSCEVRHFRRDGGGRWAHITVALVRDDEGRPDYLVFVVEDITARKHAEEELRKLSRAVEQASESIVITDATGAIEYVNDSLVQVSGYPRAELIGRNPRILQSGRTPRATYEAMWAALRAGRRWTGEFHNRRKDGGEYTEAVSISPVRDADGRVTHYVAVKEDVTEKRHTELELERHRHELEELVTERTTQFEDARRQAEAANEAKSAFLANMSHEIRTPMNGVLGMLELLARTRMTRDQREMLRTARDSGRTLLGIIDDILDFSKIEAGRLEIESVPTTMAEIVESLCDSLVPVASRKSVDLSVFVAPEIPRRLLVDPLRLRQVLLNLISNAIKFSGGRTDSRGRVALRVTIARADPLVLEFTVTDNGIGMSTEVMGRLFTPFTQAEVSTTRRYGGTGLGLTICKRLVDLMDGRIAVWSEVGVGSRFTVTLPCEVTDPAPLPPGIDLSGLRCIVVATPVLDVEGVCAYLSYAGAEIRQATSVAEAMSMAGGAAPPVVIVRHADGPAPEGGEARPDSTEIRWLVLGRGRSRRARIEWPDVATLDGTALRREALVRAVAVAAGRASPEPVPDVDPTDESGSVKAGHASGRPTDLILVAEDDEVSQNVIRRQLQMLGRPAEFAQNGAVALSMWREGHFALLLTDLHMPAKDGYALAETIRREEVGLAGARPLARMPIIALTANALRGEADRARAAGMDDYLTKPLPLMLLRDALDRWLSPSSLATSIPRAAGALSPREAPALSVAVMRDLLGGDEPGVRDLLSVFRNGATTMYEELRGACESGHSQRAASIAHRLKTSARAAGAVALADLCAAIEQAGKAGDQAAVVARLPAFADELRRVEAAIDLYLAGGGG
ncbi:MAG: PAS domain S-box protein, partial [Vicinamibacterales bacterium]